MTTDGSGQPVERSQLGDSMGNEEKRVNGEIIAVLSAEAALAGLLGTSLRAVRQAMLEQIGAHGGAFLARAGSRGSFLHQHHASSAGEHRSDAVQAADGGIACARNAFGYARSCVPRESHTP